MGIFGFGKKKGPSATLPSTAATALAAFWEARLKDKDGRIRVEDLLSAAAATTGQVCIAANGEFDPDSHEFRPGSAVLSSKINMLLFGDVDKWEAVPPEDSVFGILYSQSQKLGYGVAAFPPLADVIRLYPAQVGQVEWGWAPLSVEQPLHRPRMSPLQAACELRDGVRGLLEAQAAPVAGQPLICAAALALVLSHVRTAIEPAAAVRIVLETTNAMAKTAPMTKRHMAELAAQRQAQAPSP